MLHEGVAPDPTSWPRVDGSSSREAPSLEAPVFASASSSTSRTSLRLLLIGLALVLGASFAQPAATAGDRGKAGDAPYRGKIVSLMQHMTLQQKVGQLFVIEVAGRDATTVSDSAR